MKLNPPINVRDVQPKSCLTCKYRYSYNSDNYILSHCKRCDVEESPPWGDCVWIDTTVCDGYSRGVSNDE